MIHANSFPSKMTNTLYWMIMLTTHCKMTIVSKDDLMVLFMLILQCVVFYGFLMVQSMLPVRWTSKPMASTRMCIAELCHEYGLTINIRMLLGPITIGTAMTCCYITWLCQNHGEVQWTNVVLLWPPGCCWAGNLAGFLMTAGVAPRLVGWSWRWIDTAGATPPSKKSHRRTVTWLGCFGYQVIRLNQR